MPPKRKPPTYLRNGPKLARTFVRWPDGRTESKSLGDYGSPESYAEHARLVAEWRAAWQADADGEPRVKSGPVLTVDDLVFRYWLHEESERVEVNGKPKRELLAIKHALRPLTRLYGHVFVRDFGPKSLKVVVRAMADGSWMTDADRAHWAKRGRRADGWCRKRCNRNLWRLKAVFKWAESEELVPPGTHNSMLTVPGFAEGTRGVRETNDVLPVPEKRLQSILEQLPPIPKIMVQVQLLTGMRPGELVRLTPGSLSRGDSVEVAPDEWLPTKGLWAWLPSSHKTAHKKKKRIILFGVEAQQLLQPLLDGRQADKPVFSPAENVAMIALAKRAARKTKVQPSQQNRRAASRRRPPADCYTSESYNRAFARACKKAFPAESTYHVHQMRHNAATRLNRQFGREVTRIILGHSTAATSDIYIAQDFGKAIDAMGQTG